VVINLSYKVSSRLVLWEPLISLRLQPSPSAGVANESREIILSKNELALFQSLNLFSN
jgi:hypothetical protein